MIKMFNEHNFNLRFISDWNHGMIKSLAEPMINIYSGGHTAELKPRRAYIGRMSIGCFDDKSNMKKKV